MASSVKSSFQFEERKKNPIAGVDVCDVPECFCKEVDEETTSAFPTGTQSPVSGSQSPDKTNEKVTEGNKTIKSKLKKVRRALKTLGVKLLEFEDTDERWVHEPQP